MSNQFIVPITPITPISSLSELRGVGKVDAQQNAGQMSFSSILEQAIDTVKQTDAAENEDAYNLAMGDTDALHDIQINQQKAYLAIEMLQSVRNKVLDSYKEIMNMGV